MRLLLFILLIPCLAFGQIQTVTFDNFSGGLNRTSSSLSSPASGYDIVDFDLDPLGSLSPRLGMDVISFGGDSISAVLPYSVLGDKYLILKECNNLDTCNYVFTRTDTDSIGFTRAWNPEQFDALPQTGLNSAVWGDLLYIVGQNTPMTIFDGARMYPAAPLGPGQPEILRVRDSVADAGAGTNEKLDGVFRYKYGYRDETSPDFKTNMGPASWPVGVIRGNVTISLTNPQSHDRIYIYRDYNMDGVFRAIDSLEDASSYTDSLPYDPDNQDAPDFPYGWTPRCYTNDGAPKSNDSWTDTSSFVSWDHFYPPGGFTARPGSVAPVGFGLNWPLPNTTLMVSYAIAYLDTLNRRSYMGGAVCTGPADSQATIDMIDMPVPTDDAIKYKLLLRSFGRYCPDSSCYADYEAPMDTTYFCHNSGKWYIVDTLAVDVTTYTDSLPACSIHVDAREYYAPDLDYYAGGNIADYLTGYNCHACENCEDSILTFFPTDIAVRNGLATAIGHPVYGNTLFLSNFYQPNVWPYNKTLIVPSSEADWLVKLAVEGDDNLLGFRQNSIVRVSGFTYYQYVIAEVATGIGATSPQSVVGTNRYTYFAHSTGAYRIPANGTPQKMTIGIQPLWDSLSANWRHMIGARVGDEYWLSTQNSSFGTLVWSETLEKWRRYNFTFDAVIPFSTDTTDYDFSVNSYVLLRNDSLFQLRSGFEDDTTLLKPRWRSPELFTGPARERIYWVDIEGWGDVDTIAVVGYRANGDTIGTYLTTVGWSTEVEQTYPSNIRVKIDEIVQAFAFEIICTPGADTGNDYRITSATVHYQPWDEGKLR